MLQSCYLYTEFSTTEFLCHLLHATGGCNIIPIYPFSHQVQNLGLLSEIAPHFSCPNEI